MASAQAPKAASSAPRAWSSSAPNALRLLARSGYPPELMAVAFRTFEALGDLGRERG